LVWTDIGLTFVLLHNRLTYTYIVGTIVQLRVATITFVMKFYPSVRMEQLRFHWMEFHENDNCVYLFSKTCRKNFKIN